MNGLDAATLRGVEGLLRRSAQHAPFTMSRVDAKKFLVDCNGTVLLRQEGNHTPELLDAIELAVMEANMWASPPGIS